MPAPVERVLTITTPPGTHPAELTEANIETFWNSTTRDDETGCLVWMRATGRTGYGVMSVSRKWGKKKIYAHRIAYTLAHGPIPQGVVVDHLCGNRACVEGSHLRPLTRADNVRHQKVRADNTSGYRGVSRSRGGRWVAAIQDHGKARYLGTFDTPEQAAECAKAERVRCFGDHLEVTS